MTAATDAPVQNDYTEIWRGVRVAVFDVDGTLYRQRPLRLLMAARMAWALPWSARGRRTIRAIADFRSQREDLAEREVTGVTRAQYAVVAARFGMAEDDVRAIIDEWVERRPLRYLERCREPGIAELFQALRDAGITIAVLSDYPAHGKLRALGLTADIVVSAVDSGVDRFKPSTAGLERILAQAREAADRCLVIGDRRERDGECARRAGARFLLKVRSKARAPAEVRDYRELIAAVQRAATGASAPAHRLERAAQ